MGEPRTDAARLWRLYAEHARLLFRSGPKPTFLTTRTSFFAASGLAHVDMNQAVLFGSAAADHAEELAREVRDVEVPCLLGCSDGVLDRVSAALSSAGFQRLPNREALFWRPGEIDRPPPSPFDVRRVRTATDVDAMLSIFEEAHGYDPAEIRALYGDRVEADDGFSAWLAWDGTEPVSFSIVIGVGTSLSIWQVMTPARHRRRGGARAVVSGALAAVAAAAPHPIEDTLFWASPAGRPLYAAMGFVVADDVDAWTVGASPEDLAAVGA